MKSIIITSLAGVVAIALSAAAEPANENAKTEISVDASVDANAALLNQVSETITAKPSTAAEVVKQAILQSKANAEQVLQIVKAAVLAAPEQAEAIRKVALALAPDAEKEVEIVIASVLQGDQVADAASDAANAARDKNKNAGNEPEGREPQKNTVWLTNFGALIEGHLDANSLPSKVQDTAISPNVNHNQGANVRGGTTVIIRPNPTTVILTPP